MLEAPPHISKIYPVPVWASSDARCPTGRRPQSPPFRIPSALVTVGISTSAGAPPFFFFPGRCASTLRRRSSFPREINPSAQTQTTRIPRQWARMRRSAPASAIECGTSYKDYTKPRVNRQGLPPPRPSPEHGQQTAQPRVFILRKTSSPYASRPPLCGMPEESPSARKQILPACSSLPLSQFRSPFPAAAPSWTASRNRIRTTQFFPPKPSGFLVLSLGGACLLGQRSMERDN